MDDKFDSYIASQLRDIEDAPVPNLNWNRSEAWSHIHQNIRTRTPKLVPMYWLYMAAGVAILLTLPLAFWTSIQKQNTIDQLQNKLAIKAKVTERLVYVPQVVSKTLYKRVTDTVYITKTEMVYNTVFKTDTIIIAQTNPTKETERAVPVIIEKSKRIYVDQIDSETTDVASTESVTKPKFRLSANPNEGYVPSTELYLFKSTIQ